ncbi:MAG: histidine kinase [Prolixibacteraceae bacterium]|nr:histidine kinase [Prolixibacteraceae bacterium]
MKRIILVLLVLFGSQFLRAEIMNSEIQKLAKEQIESKFIRVDRPVRYTSNILILLQGFPTKQDSLIFRELIDTLNVLIEKWDVVLIPNETSNLSVIINLPHKGISKSFIIPDVDQMQIIKSTVYLDLPDNMDFISRKKNIYYYVLRTLAVLKTDQNIANPIAGSIFTESKAENITFHPVDFEIVKEIYSDKYENQPDKLAGRKMYVFNTIWELIAILIAIVYLIFISQSGVFIKHHYKFAEYMKQGIFVFVALLIFVVLYNSFVLFFYPSKIQLWLSFGAPIVGLFLVGNISIVIMYFFERFVLYKKDNFLLEVIIPFITTLFVPPILLLLSMFSSILSNLLNSNWMMIIRAISFIMLIAIARAFFIYMNRKSENIIRKKDLELAQLNELHKQAELQSLRAKINPHFLYNALNSIASLATTDARKTEQMALALSDFFKYAINREQKQLNTLSEELNAIRTYLEIEKVRFGDRLSFEIDCPEELMNIQIPQLLIQPLVENAIKHGLSQITENGLIGILVCKEDGLLKIRVYDNGPAFPDGPLSGFGIQNTQERIALLYGAKATINWQNGAEKYIEISIPV